MITKITSAANPRIKALEKYQRSPRARAEAGIFIAEGEKLLREAPPEWIDELYVAESAIDRLTQSVNKTCQTSVPSKGVLDDTVDRLTQSVNAEPQDGLGNSDGFGDIVDRLTQSVNAAFLLPDSLFARVCDTQTPQGFLAVLRRPSYSIEQVCGFGSRTLLLVLEDIQDPGNLGTMVRTAECAGVSGIILTSGCTDILGPKAVRGSMGSVYRVPFVELDTIETVFDLLGSSVTQIRTYATSPDSSASYDECDYIGPTAFIIGNEARGLSDTAMNMAACRIGIPMMGRAQSLNAAVSAAILLYEASRQRRMSRNDAV